MSLDTKHSPANRWRRFLIRAFVLLFVIVIVHETVPFGNLDGIQRRPLSPVLARLGLSQGVWRLFAPNPNRMTSWVSAEMQRSDGQLTTWQSPIWADVGAIEKFFRFRHLNYYNRFQKPLYPTVAQDLADQLRRSQLDAESIRQVRLYQNRLTILLDDEQEYPSREQTYRLFSRDSLSF